MMCTFSTLFSHNLLTLTLYLQPHLCLTPPKAHIKLSKARYVMGPHAIALHRDMREHAAATRVIDASLQTGEPSNFIALAPASLLGAQHDFVAALRVLCSTVLEKRRQVCALADTLSE